MSILLFRKHSKVILEKLSKGVELPNSKHVYKRFNQSDLFRMFAVRCPVNSLMEQQSIQKMIKFRASLGIKDRYVCGQCPFQTKCSHAFNKLGEETKPEFDLNLLSFYIQQLSKLDDDTFNAILAAKNNQFNTVPEERNDNHFIYWGSTLRILDTLERIVQDTLENKSEYTTLFVQQNEAYSKTVENTQGSTYQGQSNNSDTSQKKERNEEFTRQFTKSNPFSTNEREPHQQKKEFSIRQEQSNSSEREPYQKRDYKKDNQASYQPYLKKPSQFNNSRGIKEPKKYLSGERVSRTMRKDQEGYRVDRYDNHSSNSQNDYTKNLEQNRVTPQREVSNDYEQSENIPKFKKEFVKKIQNDEDATTKSRSDDSLFGTERKEKQPRQKQSQNDEQEGGSLLNAKRITPEDMLMRKSDTKKEGGINPKDPKFKFSKTV